MKIISQRTMCSKIVFFHFSFLNSSVSDSQTPSRDGYHLVINSTQDKETESLFKYVILIENSRILENKNINSTHDIRSERNFRLLNSFNAEEKKCIFKKNPSTGRFELKIENFIFSNEQNSTH